MSSKTFLLLSLFLHAFFSYVPAINCSLFSEYIGAEFSGVKFTDVPINPNVDVHFILSFAIDYTTGSNPTQTNGNFNVFWDTGNLTPESVSSIKQTHSNVKVALSLGGDSVQGNDKVYFNPSSVDSWVSNAVSSLTKIIQQYNLDGIDIDYERFSVDGDTFAECIGRLITTLKNNGVISFASIAPYEDEPLQSNYMALWSKYRDVIDYVNFQFYGYASSTTVPQFLNYFERQSTNYDGRKLMVSFATDNVSGGLRPRNGFFTACGELRSQGKLNGIFIWSADDSFKNRDGFQYEKQSQSLLSTTASSFNL